MIESAIALYQNTTLIVTNEQADPSTLTLIKSALSTIKKQESKVVQIASLRLGIASIKYKADMMVFGVYGQGTDPKQLMDCSADLAEEFIRDWGRQAIEDPGVKAGIKRAFESVVERYNKKINESQRTIVEIDNNLKEGIDISKQSMNKFIERGSQLEDMYQRSSALNSDALNFEKSGRRLKYDIQRQKMKVYIVVGSFVLITLFFFFKMF